MIIEPIYDYDQEAHEAICILTYNNITFTGTAKCHPDDYDMENTKTGLAIAEYRATIKYYQHIKNNELKPKLDALLQLYYSMNRSKNFNEKSYENYMLWRQIQIYKEDLAVVRCSLATLRKNLMDYLRDKDDFYKTIRRNRKANEVIQNKDKSDQ